MADEVKVDAPEVPEPEGGAPEGDASEGDGDGDGEQFCEEGGGRLKKDDQDCLSLKVINTFDLTRHFVWLIILTGVFNLGGRCPRAN